MSGQIEDESLSTIFDYQTNRRYKYHRSPVFLLYQLSDPKHKEVSLKLLKLAERIIATATVIDIHFLYAKFIDIYKKFRNEEKMIEYCKDKLKYPNLPKPA